MRQFKLLCVSKAEFSEFSIHVFIDLNSFDVTCYGYLGFTAVAVRPLLNSQVKINRLSCIFNFEILQTTKDKKYQCASTAGTTFTGLHYRIWIKIECFYFSNIFRMQQQCVMLCGTCHW